MRKTRSDSRPQFRRSKTNNCSDTDAIAAGLLNGYLKHRQAVERHGLMYLMSLTHNVLLKDQRELGCSHPEMMTRLLPWLEPSVVRALPAIFEQELACTRRAQGAA